MFKPEDIASIVQTLGTPAVIFLIWIHYLVKDSKSGRRPTHEKNEPPNGYFERTEKMFDAFTAELRTIGRNLDAQRDALATQTRAAELTLERLMELTATVLPALPAFSLLNRMNENVTELMADMKHRQRSGD